MPAEVRLIAAISRLLDLHQSRSTSVYVPDVPESAGRNLYVALTMIGVLGKLDLDAGPHPCSIQDLYRRCLQIVPDLGIEEFEFCVESLAQSREIRFGATDATGRVIYPRTSDTTPLVTLVEGFNQVQLTDNGRLFLRVTSNQESWLYSDVDADRLEKAILRGQFNDVPRFCRQMVLDLANKARVLNDVAERPTLTELRDSLIDEGARIGEVLHKAAATIAKAMQWVFSDQTREAFENWQRRENAGFELGNLQSELELVLQNVESLSRRFVRFLENAQSVSTVQLHSIRFLDVAERLPFRFTLGMREYLQALLPELLPWNARSTFFVPDFLAGEVSLARLLGEPSSPDSDTFRMEDVHLPAPTRLHEFLLTNRAVVLERLSHGPVTFSELVNDVGFALEEGDQAADFVGLYSTPEVLDGDGMEIHVGLTDALFEVVTPAARLISSDPIIMLKRSQR